MPIAKEEMASFEDNEKSTSVYSFKPEFHFDKVLEAITLMRRQEILTDVVLVVEGVKFPAHKNVLAASSDYFNAMFSSLINGQQETRKRLQGVSAKAVKELLDFMYQGEIEITEDNVEEVLVASRLFLLDNVTQACCKFAQDRINVNNCWGIRNMADKLSCCNLLGRANTFIEDNFAQAKGSPEFLTLPFELMKELMADDELNVREDELVSAVLKWVEHDCPARNSYLIPLFKLLRLSYISGDCTSRLFAHELIANDTCLLQLIRAAREANFSASLSKLLTPEEYRKINKPRKWQRIVPILTAVGGTQTVFYNSEEKIWVSLAPITTRHCPGLVGLGSKMYLVGGSRKWIRLGDCEMFSPESDTWEDMTPMRIPRSNIGLVVLEKLLYAVGGYDGNTPTRFVERYDPQKNEWVFVSSMNSHRDGACVVSDCDNIFAISGFDGNSYLNTMEVYDPCKDVWEIEDYAPITEARQDAMSAHVNGKVYVIGGYRNQECFASGEAYDIELNVWTPIAPMLVERNKAGCAALGHKIYICGGWEGSGMVLTSVEFYDTETDSWTSVTSLPTPSAMRAAFVFFPRKQVDVLSTKSKSKKRKSIHAVITSAAV